MFPVLHQGIPHDCPDFGGCWLSGVNKGFRDSMDMVCIEPILLPATCVALAKAGPRVGSHVFFVYRGKSWKITKKVPCLEKAWNLKKHTLNNHGNIM